MAELHLYDFGIFLELEPDDEEKGLLENNIQAGLANNTIELGDAIDLRNCRNLKLANQLLKIRRKKKMEQDQKDQLAQTKAQGESQAQASQAAAEAEVHKNTAVTDNTIKIENAKKGQRAEILELEAKLKKELMDHEFELNKQIEQMKLDAAKSRDTNKENRSDGRVKMQATQQSEMLDQKSNNKPAKNFESSGNDVLGGFKL